MRPTLPLSTDPKAHLEKGQDHTQTHSPTRQQVARHGLSCDNAEDTWLWNVRNIRQRLMRYQENVMRSCSNFGGVYKSYDLTMLEQLK